MEYPKLVSAEYVVDYSLRLFFSDGTSANVDLKDELSGGIFEALRDPAYFRTFTVQHQFGTIEWDNGADFAPEFLYQVAQASRQQKSEFNNRTGTLKSA